MARVLGVLRLCIIVAMVLPQAASPAKPGDGWFPFSFNSPDGKLGLADVSWLNDPPAGKDGFVSIRDGHFVDGTGQRIRFFATNLTATACFPDPAQAPLLAARLRALGFNLVRLHYMDIAAPSGLFRKDLLTIDPEQLARLDGLLAALKAEGIYINLNLHVSRCYPGIEGEAAQHYRQGKILDRFYPPFIEMQKQYARDLLTHVNPHTGLALGQDPGIMCIELNNENTLLPFWFDTPFDLPEPFAGELARQWRVWLKDKYGTTEAVRRAWTAGEKEPGPEMLRNADLTKGTAEWSLQTSGGAEAELTSVTAEDGDLPKGTPALKWKALKKGGASWHLQLMQNGLDFAAGCDYEISFMARAQEPLALEVTAMLDVDPWSNLGFTETASLDTEWRRFSFRFKSSSSGGPRGRLNFSTANKTGTAELAQLSVRAASAVGLPPGESLELDNISLRHAGTTPQASLDYWTFLVETERNTTSTLMNFLRNDLGIRQPVCDTQASYGDAAGVLREAELSDFVDMHGYWEHPSGGWTRNWTIGNHSQVTAGSNSTLESIATHRVLGKPFAVSEYNIPNPNDHGAETFPMLAAIAAFQDWDAIYPYTFLDFKREWNSDRLLGFFDLAGNSAKLAFAPAAALAFRKGLVSSGGDPVILKLPTGSGPRLFHQGTTSMENLWRDGGVSSGAFSLRRMAIEIAGPEDDISVSEPVRVPKKRRSETGELAWEPAGRHPAFSVVAPAFRFVAGHVTGERIKLGDLRIEFGRPEKDYACVSVVALDAKPVRESSRVLVTIAGRYENQEMGWNAARTTVEDRWGRGPAVAERIPARLILPGKGWRVEALDGAGRPAAEVPVKKVRGGTAADLHRPGSASLLYLATR